MVRVLKQLPYKERLRELVLLDPTKSRLSGIKLQFSTTQRR